MKEKELKLEINGKDYSVIIKEFSAYEAVLSVNGKQYQVGLKDLGLQEIADVKPVPARRHGEAPSKPQIELPADTKITREAKPDMAYHRPDSVVNARSIVAPLPGMIQKLHVQLGDVVKVGQRILTLEAMKMENEINASVDGMIKEIRYKEGDSVNQGAVMVVLEYLEE